MTLSCCGGFLISKISDGAKQMKIECPKCKAAYKVDDTKLPDKGVLVKCKKCQNQFFVKKETTLIVDPIEEVDEIIEYDTETTGIRRKCPRCNLPQEGLDKCEYCGFVFEDAKKKREESFKAQERTEETKKKPSNISTIASWFFGIIFLIGALGFIANGMIVQSILYLIIAAILIPPIVKKLPINLSRRMKIVVVIICFFAAPFFSGLYGLPSKTGPAKTSTYSEQKSTETKSVKRAPTELSSDMKASINKYVNDWVRTKSFIRSGFWDGTANIQIFFELDIRYLGKNPKMEAEQFSDHVVQQAVRTFKHDFCIHTYYGDQKKLSMSCEIYRD